MTKAVAPLQDAFWRACEQLLYLHTTPWELDEALVAWGYGIGPCEAQDLVGLDAVLAERRGAEVTPILPRMVEEGRLGKRFGWGYYRYPGGGGAVIDPLIEDLITEEAWFGKISRSDLSGVVLVDHLHDAVRDDLRAAADKAVALLHFPQDRLAVL